MLPYILTFAEGILTFISPCILPMLPVYFMYLAGTPDTTDSRNSHDNPAAEVTSGSPDTTDRQNSNGNPAADAAPDNPTEEGAPGNPTAEGAPGSPAVEVTPGNPGNPGTPGKSGIRRSSSLIINSLGFVSGFTLVFIILGAVASTLGSYLESNRDLLQKISGVVMILFGLNFTGIIKIGFLNSEKKFHINVDNLRFISSILFGAVFGLGWSPCLGTFLGSALILAGNSGTVAEGILLLLVYSLGLAIPFVVSAAIFENVKGLFAWLRKNSRIISIISGILLIAAGILVFTDNLKYLTLS